MISKEEEESTATAEALLQWVNSFDPLPPSATSSPSTPPPPPLTKLEQLTDGLLLADVLHDIAPTRFPRDLFARPPSSSAASTPTTPTANWALALTNLKKLTRLLEAHYQEELGLHLHGGRGGSSSSYFASLDLAGIAREKRSKDIMKLLELVVLAAVRAPAPEKARAYVEKIMGLSPEAQAVLKESVERTLQHATPSSFSPSSSPPSSASSSSFLDAITSTTTSSSSLSSLPSSSSFPSTAADEQQRENNRLYESIQELQSRLSKTEEEVRVAKEEARGWKVEVEGHQHRWTAAVARAEELQKACEEWRVKLEEREQEREHWRQEARRWEDRVKGERERAEKAEEGGRRLADEVDVLREKADAAHDLEQTLEKYKLRLEQASAAKQHCRDLEEQNAKYLDQMLVLEEEVKTSVPALKRVIEQYKEKVVGLERERYQAVERREVMEGELGRMKEEVEGAREARRFLAEECQELKRVVQQLQQQLAQQQEQQQQQQPQPQGGGGGGEEGGKEGGLGLFENAMDVKEKLLRLERENKMLRKQVEEGGWPKVGGEEDLLLLKSQMQDLQRVKEEREAEAIAAKKRAAELEGHVVMLRGQCEEMEEEVGRAKEEGVAAATAAAAAAVAGQEKALAKVQLLLQQAKEREQQVLTLKGEKDRLEEYTKKTLQAVQEKYVQTLGSLKGSNAEYKARNQVLEARLVQDKQVQKREERLLMSCVYGLGMEMLQAERREGGRKG